MYPVKGKTWWAGIGTLTHYQAMQAITVGRLDDKKPLQNALKYI